MERGGEGRGGEGRGGGEGGRLFVSPRPLRCDSE